jgi:hypothetical protein
VVLIRGDQSELLVDPAVGLAVEVDAVDRFDAVLEPRERLVVAFFALDLAVEDDVLRDPERLLTAFVAVFFAVVLFGVVFFAAD